MLVRIGVTAMTFELDLQEEPEYYDEHEPLSCRDCGSEEVHWENIDDKWVLCNNKDDKKHFC